MFSGIFPVEMASFMFLYRNTKAIFCLFYKITKVFSSFRDVIHVCTRPIRACVGRMLFYNWFYLTLFSTFSKSFGGGSHQSAPTTPTCNRCRCDVIASTSVGPSDTAKGNTADQEVYEGVGDRKLKVRSVSQFVGIPAPDVYGHCPPLNPEPFCPKKSGIQRFVGMVM